MNHEEAFGSIACPVAPLPAPLPFAPRPPCPAAPAYVASPFMVSDTDVSSWATAHGMSDVHMPVPATPQRTPEDAGMHYTTSAHQLGAHMINSATNTATGCVDTCFHTDFTPSEVLQITNWHNQGTPLCARRVSLLDLAAVEGGCSRTVTQIRGTSVRYRPLISIGGGAQSSSECFQVQASWSGRQGGDCVFMCLMPCGPFDHQH